MTDTPQFRVPQGIERWLLNEIIDGMKDMIIIKLPEHPALETIAVVALKWCETLQFNTVWDQELDTPRIRCAFKALMREAKWPSPHRFLEALPPRPQQLELPPPPTHEESLEILEFLKTKKLELQIKTVERQLKQSNRLSYVEVEPDPDILAKQEHIRNLAQTAGWKNNAQS